MPICKVTVYKALIGETGETWTNVYNVNALGPNDAASIGETIQALEKAVSYDWVAFPKVAAQLAAGGPSVVHATPGETGDISGDVNNAIPLFNTVRVTLNDGQNRPEIKYLRGLLQEANVAGFNISDEVRIQIQDGYVTPLPDILGLCGPSGEPIVSATLALPIQMRQLGWNRRTRPGFKRGWVPV
jgi:hypothetical protein